MAESSAKQDRADRKLSQVYFKAEPGDWNYRACGRFCHCDHLWGRIGADPCPRFPAAVVQT
jgi:hypothetical protein